MFAPEGADLVGVVDGLLDAFETERELAAHEDEGLRDLQRVGRDDDALDQLVRIALQEQVVLEGGRLGLVAVHHEVRDRRLAQHRPLAPGRKPGAAAPEQRRLVDLAGDRFGEHREGLAQRVVAAGREVARQRVRVGVARARDEHDARRVEGRHYCVSFGVRSSRAAVAARRSLATSARGARSPPVRRTRISVPWRGDVVVRRAGAQLRRRARRRPPVSSCARSGGSPARTARRRSRRGTRSLPA